MCFLNTKLLAFGRCIVGVLSAWMKNPSGSIPSCKVLPSLKRTTCVGALRQDLAEAIASVMRCRFHIGPVARSHRPTPALPGAGVSHPLGGRWPLAYGGPGLAASLPQRAGKRGAFPDPPDGRAKDTRTGQHVTAITRLREILSQSSHLRRNLPTSSCVGHGSAGLYCRITMPRFADPVAGHIAAGQKGDPICRAMPIFPPPARNRG